MHSCAFQNLGRFIPWSFNQSFRVLKIKQLFFWQILNLYVRNWRNVQWKQSNTKLKLKFRVPQFFPDVQKPVFRIFWWSDKTLNTNLCPLQVFFWPNFKCSTNFEWKVDLKITQSQVLTETVWHTNFRVVFIQIG